MGRDWQSQHTLPSDSQTFDMLLTFVCLPSSYSLWFGACFVFVFALVLVFALVVVVVGVVVAVLLVVVVVVPCVCLLVLFLRVLVVVVVFCRAEMNCSSPIKSTRKA